MTVSTTNSAVSYTGDGSTTAFAVTFEFIDSSEVKVYTRVIASGIETLKSLTTHYTLAGGSGSTGTVTFVTPPPSTEQVHIIRDTTRTQPNDFTPSQRFPSASVERALDRGAMRDQDDEFQVGKSLRAPLTDSSGLSMQLPNSVDRASKVLGFDSNGAPVATTQGDQSALTVLATGTTTARSLAERAVDVVHVKDFGAKGDGVTDDAAAIDAALAFVKDTGAVLDFRDANAQHYISTTGNHVARGCTLLGAGNSGDRHAAGTGAKATIISFKSTSAANPGIKFGFTTSIVGLTFYYPDQSTGGTFTTYGPTLEGEHSGAKARSCTIEGNTFINSFHAISDGVAVASGNSMGFSRIANNRICALSVGLSIAGSAAEITIANNVFSYGFWVHRTAAAATTISSTATAIKLGDSNNDNVDGMIIENNAIFGWNKGIDCTANMNLNTVIGGFIDGCYIGIDVHSGGNIGSSNFSNVTFIQLDPNDLTRLDGASFRFRTTGVVATKVNLSGCSFTQSNGDHIDVAFSTASFGSINISGCIFTNAGRNDTASPQSKEYNHIRIDEGSTGLIRALVSGCMFLNTANQTNSETVGIEIVDAQEITVTNCYFERMKECVRVTSGGRFLIDNCNSRASVSGNSDLVLTSVGNLTVGKNHWSSDTAEDSVASAAALPLPLSTIAESYLVTGTADITSITGGWKGRKVVLWFNGTAASTGLTDGGTLKLAGNFGYTPGDTITLINADGTNWHEISRSAN
jgi:hypothetical protein